MTLELVRKEGRALGEVTKYLVYNARKSFPIIVLRHFGIQQKD